MYLVVTATPFYSSPDLKRFPNFKFKCKFDTLKTHFGLQFAAFSGFGVKFFLKTFDGFLGLFLLSFDGRVPFATSLLVGARVKTLLRDDWHCAE